MQGMTRGPARTTIFKCTKNMKVAEFDGPFEHGTRESVTIRSVGAPGGTVRALPGTPTDRGVKDA
jgi:hypothetical protein